MDELRNKYSESDEMTVNRLVDDIDEYPGFKSNSGKAIGVGVAVLALVALFIIYREAPQEPENPIRLLIAVRSNTEANLGALLQTPFINGLAEFGLIAEAVGSDQLPDGEAALETIRQLANEARVAHGLLLDVQVELERDGFTRNTRLFRAELTVWLVPADENEYPATDSMEFTFERTTAEEMLDGVSGAFVMLLLPQVIDWLYESPGIEVAMAGDLPARDLPNARTIRQQAPRVDERRLKKWDFERYCGTEQGRLEALQDQPYADVHCLGDACGQWTVVGVDHDGSHAYVQDITRRPIFAIDPHRTRWVEPPESFFRLSLEDGVVSRLFRTGNIYGFAELTADTSLASLAGFSGEGNLAIVTMETGSADWRDVVVLERGQRAVRTLPAPDGDGVLLGMRRQRNAPPSEPYWILARGLERVPMPFGRQAAWAPTEDELLLIGLVEDDRIGFARRDGSLLGQTSTLPARLRNLVGVRGDHFWLQLEEGRGNCSLAGIDLNTLRLTRSVSLPICVDWPTVIADGRLVGAANVTSQGDTPGDSEVVVVNPETGSVLPLTIGPFDEEIVHVSQDGSRVVFNRRLERWPSTVDMEIYRRVVCFADIPPIDFEP